MKNTSQVLEIFAVALLTLITATDSRAQEPTYKGKSLTDWTGEMTLDNSKAVRDQAQEAIRQMGTNAIPFLMGELQALSDTDVTNYNTPTWQQRRFNLHNAFVALGPVAEPAIPSLTKLMNGDSCAACSAAHALAVIGPRGFSSLVKSLTNGPLVIRICIAGFMSEVGTNASIALPALIECTTYQSSQTEESAALRGFSASALGDVGINNPESVVPALVRCLQDKDYRIRFTAIRSIRQFGKRAQLAVPALQQIEKTDQNQEFRSLATALLEQIQ